jgi:hypothetical protein
MDTSNHPGLSVLHSLLPGQTARRAYLKKALRGFDAADLVSAVQDSRESPVEITEKQKALVASFIDSL